MNLENPDLRRQALDDGEAFLKNNPAPLIIDEVQYVPELLSRIQVIVDEDPKKKGLYVLTGSHQPRLKEGLSQSLAGRFVKAPKVYFTDVGLLTHLLGIRTPEQLARDPLMGGIFENMVIMQAMQRLSRA